MIHAVTLRNFCSFRDASTVDWRIDEKAPNTEQFFVSPAGVRLSKTMAVIGANAAGKTNALRALTFLAWFIRDSFEGAQSTKQIPVDPFLFRNEQETPLDFELIFESSREVYRYQLSLTTQRVISESLDILGHGQVRKYRYLMKWDGDKSGDIKVAPKLGITATTLGQLVRPTASILSAARLTSVPGLKPVFDWVESIVTNVTRALPLTTARQQMPGAALSFYSSSTRFSRALDVLKSVDLGLTDVTLHELALNNAQKEELQGIKDVLSKIDPTFSKIASGPIVRALGHHVIDGVEYTLDFTQESGGTQSLFGLLGWLLPTLERGGIAIVDELDAELHPHMLSTLFNLFFDSASNPHNAQLLFTTHAHQPVFQQFDKRQIVFVEKRDGVSSIYRLSDITGVRQDDNTFAKYNAGAYGAVPVM